MVSIVELNHINSPTIVWDKLTVNQDISVEGPEFSTSRLFVFSANPVHKIESILITDASISEETLACLHILHAGSQTKQSYLQGSRKRIDMLSIICKSGKDSEQIARHDVVIDHSIPFGEVALPFCWSYRNIACLLFS